MCAQPEDIERRIQALEMRCHRRLLNISYKDHVTNEEVRNRIQKATGVHDVLLTMVKKKNRKLNWYGHISRSSGMAKTSLQGTVKGARRRGSQKKRWEDDIKEWTGMRFGDFGGQQKTGKDGKVLVPWRPPRLRDWDEMRWTYSIDHKSLFEPQHDKTNKMIYASSEDSDEYAHSRSLIRFFAARSKDRNCPHASSYGQRWLWSVDQTGWIPLKEILSHYD